MTSTYARKAWTVIGYTADAATWCEECAAVVYGLDIDNETTPALDNEGNDVHPIFASDELTAGTCCTRCGEGLDA